MQRHAGGSLAGRSSGHACVTGRMHPAWLALSLFLVYTVQDSRCCDVIIISLDPLSQHCKRDNFGFRHTHAHGSSEREKCKNVKVITLYP